jgi:hypothetical protein
MELPTALVEHRLGNQKKDARDALINADRQLNETPAGQLPRDEFEPKHGKMLKKTWEAPAPRVVEE